uniref:Uncharacterized protein n=1 Tax=Amphimedon queenslandica TaxID=400682 RepID=A0A1X7V3P3_AMPQE
LMLILIMILYNGEESMVKGFPDAQMYWERHFSTNLFSRSRESVFFTQIHLYNSLEDYTETSLKLQYNKRS